MKPEPCLTAKMSKIIPVTKDGSTSRYGTQEYGTVRINFGKKVRYVGTLLKCAYLTHRTKMAIFSLKTSNLSKKINSAAV